MVDALTRIGHFDPEHARQLVAPCVQPGEPWGYRNKIELAFERRGQRAVVGMHDAGGTGVVKVDRCLLLESRYQKLAKAVSGALSYLANSHGLAIDRVGIRASRRTRDVEVALWTEPGPFPRAQAAKVLGDATSATSIVRVLTKGPKKARRVVGVERLSGAGSWTELIAGERMTVSAPSFFQVNTKGAEKLVDLVLAGLAPNESDVAMDLYSGAGTFTLPLARRTSWVDAVESYGPAVRDLRRNLERAGLDNADPVGGDADREFPDSDADVIVVDPPRAGLAQDVVRKLSGQPARAIAYISCDPATLARDLARFEQEGTYAVESVTPVDLFPQTFHVETVVMLSHKKPDSVINVKVEFGEGEGKVPLDNIAKRAEAYKPKERVTYKMIKEYIEAKYGFKVHTAYIAEVKRDLGLPMYDAPNAVEELKQPRKHPTPEKVEAIKDALKHFEVI